ncbi:MAG: DNA internalization-related competence protein ComEC/Rec2 [Halothiobacillaceae bacterium]|nr:DNA internalization-related competence protein ComEC/Rec2 [Halothiobacillaceae bacterium]
MLKPAESLGDAPSIGKTWRSSKCAVLPLWQMALILLAGTALVLAFPWLALQVVFLFGIALLLAAGAWFFTARRAVFVVLAWLVLSMAWGGLAVHEVRSGWLPAALEVQKLTFEVRVLGLSEPGSRGTAFAAQVMSAPSGVEYFPKALRLHWYDEPPLLRPGEVWRVTARLKRPHGAVNGVGMDYEAWLFRQGVQATGSVSAGERVAEPVAWSVNALRWQVREHLMTLMAGEPSASLVLGLVLGDRSLMTQAQWEVLLASGTNHLLAISGLHVTMIAGMVWWLAAWSWRRLPRLALWIPAQVAGALAGLLAALGYSLLAGFSVPTQRTLFMLLALVLAVVARRELVARDILGLALLLVLLWDPLSVLDVGFWLSFAAVGLLIFASSGQLARPAWWRELGTAQWAAFVGLLPLTVLLFQRGSWVSPLANLLAIPWVSLWVTPLALLGTLLSFVYAPLGDMLLWLALRSLDGLMWLLAQMTSVSWALWFPPTPSGWAFVLAVPGVFWLLAPRGVPLRGLALLLFLPLFLPRLEQPAPGELWLDWLDVGQGQAVLLRTATHQMLYDAGPVNFGGRDAGAEVVLPVLRSLGVDGLDVVMLSNSDRDHAGGLRAIEQGVALGGVWSGGEMVQGAQACRQGLYWAWDGVDFKVLHPGAGFGSDKDNDWSCVLKIDSPGGRVLLSGDIERRAELALLTSGEDLRAEVLQVPHHGSKTSSDVRLIAAVNPQLAVVSAGYRNPFKHPRPEVLARYVALGAQTVTTPDCGRIQLRLREGHAPEVRCAREAWPWAWRVPVERNH